MQQAIIPFRAILLSPVRIEKSATKQLFKQPKQITRFSRWWRMLVNEMHNSDL